MEEGKEVLVSKAAMRGTLLALLAVAALVNVLVLTASPAVKLWSAGAAVIMAVVTVLAHEGLHTVGHVVFGRVPYQSVKPAGVTDRSLGFAWTNPARRCLAVESSNGFRWAAFLPGLVLGLIPMVAGLAAGNLVLVAAGLPGIASARGDFATLWQIRRLRASAQVLDHPTGRGVLVISE